MLVINDFIRSLFDKYGTNTVYINGCSWYPDLYFSVRKRQVEITSRKSVIKKEMQIFKPQQYVLMIDTNDLIIKILNEIYHVSEFAFNYLSIHTFLN